MRYGVYYRQNREVPVFREINTHDVAARFVNITKTRTDNIFNSTKDSGSIVEKFRHHFLFENILGEFCLCPFPFDTMRGSTFLQVRCMPVRIIRADESKRTVAFLPYHPLFIEPVFPEWS